jgi:hypothetical protein
MKRPSFGAACFTCSFSTSMTAERNLHSTTRASGLTMKGKVIYGNHTVLLEAVPYTSTFVVESQCCMSDWKLGIKKNVFLQNATTFFRTYLAHIEASCGKDLTLLNHQKVSLAANGAG